ncbi:protein kinase C-binding protein NELL2-like, partial [Stylophora pistillata]|uniref:protein kinase C-binding protein NELL2-like n=1 Tax=Stylophora pistillata TaxID=50429 RepID=UPI000C052533
IDEYKGNHSCHVNATCTNTNRLYVCTYIDECESNNNFCDENANCSNAVGSFNCTCKDGFTGDGHSCS